MEKAFPLLPERRREIKQLIHTKSSPDGSKVPYGRKARISAYQKKAGSEK